MAVLELRENNLYASGFVIEFSNGELLLEREQFVTEGSLEDDYHVVVQGDRLDRIAFDFYNEFVEDSSKYWFLIADANGIDTENPLDISGLVGSEILIPNVLNSKLELGQ